MDPPLPKIGRHVLLCGRMRRLYTHPRHRANSQRRFRTVSAIWRTGPVREACEPRPHPRIFLAAACGRALEPDPVKAPRAEARAKLAAGPHDELYTRHRTPDLDYFAVNQSLQSQAPKIHVRVNSFDN